MREFEKGGGRTKPVLLEMDKCAGELDEAFVESIVCCVPLGKPKLLQNVVRFIKELLIEALEVTQIVRIVRLASARSDQRRDFF